MGLLTCSRCKEGKPADLAHFPPHRGKNNGLDSWCRECRRAYRKARRIPSGVNDVGRAMEAKSLPACIICGVSGVTLAVDHNHKSGHVRGALCINCNLGIGQFKDDPSLLRLAALYLEGRCACGECDVYWGDVLEEVGAN
jgi:hypothetical protein